ncbi:MAG: hypothetical protein WCO00_03285 [Rhodospirillaceae bacterium]
MTSKPFIPTLTEGMVRKGGHNTGPSAVKTRPPGPGAMLLRSSNPGSADLILGKSGGGSYKMQLASDGLSTLSSSDIVIKIKD